MKCVLAQALPLRTAGLLLTVILLLSAVTLSVCGGHLIYSLDDPYISLGLGWNIGHGHYGLNSGETASPSSSILYPFVLASFAWTSGQEWVPLWFNSMAAAGTAALFAVICLHYSIGARPRDMTRTTFLLVALCIGMNIVGLVFTGLEHSIHALSSAAIVYGLARTLEDGRAPRWLLPVLVLNPLWRFEGIALTCLTLAALAWSGHVRIALLGLTASVVAVGADMLFMHSLELPLLPSSVLIKATVFSPGANGFTRLLSLVEKAFSSAGHYKAGLSLWVPFCLVLLHPVLRARGRLDADVAQRLTWRGELTLVSVVACAVMAHALFGAWGWWYRYEIYAVTICAVAILVLWHIQIDAFIRQAHPRYIVVAGLAILGLNAFYVRATLLSPLAARGIYEQQYQMHRFAVVFYREPVAVNDIGLVTYRNPQYVLDLWGLGSEAARKARLVDHEPGWLDQLTRAHDVGVAMIYTSWFAPDIPPAWRPIAVLRCAHPHISAAGDEVTFYATSPAAENSALAALHRFASQTPRAVAEVTFETAVMAVR